MDSISDGKNMPKLSPMMIQKIVQELQDLPEDKLKEIYDLIHYFRLGLEIEKTSDRTPGLLQGQLSDTFFDPLPEEELQQWE
jgi:hypothetical protein